MIVMMTVVVLSRSPCTGLPDSWWTWDETAGNYLAIVSGDARPEHQVQPCRLAGGAVIGSPGRQRDWSAPPSPVRAGTGTIGHPLSRELMSFMYGNAAYRQAEMLGLPMHELLFP